MSFCSQSQADRSRVVITPWYDGRWTWSMRGRAEMMASVLGCERRRRQRCGRWGFGHAGFRGGVRAAARTTGGLRQPELDGRGLDGGGGGVGVDRDGMMDWASCGRQ